MYFTVRLSIIVAVGAVLYFAVRYILAPLFMQPSPVEGMRLLSKDPHADMAVTVVYGYFILVSYVLRGIAMIY